MTKVKVCGITNLEDALMAVELGADALGFNFYLPSPRYLTPSEAGQIIRRLPPFTSAVGVFVNVDDAAEVDRMAKASRIRILQLHGEETADYTRALCDSWTVIKSFPVRSVDDGPQIRACPAQAVLLDTADPRLHGGTGRTFDWTICRKLEIRRPFVLAGGLNAGNVASAIRTARPYAVDVCSGIESAPGTKDRSRLLDFMREVRNAKE
jgi:phosphoribosylanthranilate isomerase